MLSSSGGKDGEVHQLSLDLGVGADWSPWSGPSEMLLGEISFGMQLISLIVQSQDQLGQALLVSTEHH